MVQELEMRSFRKPISFFAAVLTAFCLATPVVNANSLRPMSPVGPENVSACNSGKPHDLVLLIDQ